MPHPDRQNPITPPGARPQGTVILATVLIGVTAICLAWPQVFPGPEQANAMTLPNLDQRVSQFREITDPVKRDAMCIPLSAYGRALDRALAPDARVFLSGIVGKDHGGRGGYYFFLRNYLFPRTVEISLDGNAVYHEGWVEGVPCDSPAVLQAHGFDLLLLMPTNSDNIQIIPLTEKGVPK